MCLQGRDRLLSASKTIQYLHAPGLTKAEELSEKQVFCVLHLQLSNHTAMYPFRLLGTDGARELLRTVHTVKAL